MGACEFGGAEPTPAPSPAELVGATCEQREGGDPNHTPDFVRVDVSSRDGVDRVTFRFRMTRPGATEPPRFIVSYIDQLTTDGEGAPADIEGASFVSVSFQAVGTDLTREQPVQVYTGPKELTPRLPTVRELEQLGDFEGTVTWGIGLAERECSVVRATARELTIEFPSG